MTQRVSVVIFIFCIISVINVIINFKYEYMNEDHAIFIMWLCVFDMWLSNIFICI